MQAIQKTMRADSYNFFASIFLNLPDEEFIHKIRALKLSGTNALDLWEKYINESVNLSDGEMLQEILIDRTYLIRGLSQEGPRPPYESLYMGGAFKEILSSINVFYARNNYIVSPEVREPGDYIGIELSFMKALCLDGEICALQKEFYQKHLGRWAQDCAKEIIRFAKTGFYKSIGQMLLEFIAEEDSLLRSS